MVPNFATKLGDNCIQILHLGRYIVGHTVANLVLRRRTSGAVKMICDRISDDIAPQMKILNIVTFASPFLCASTVSSQTGGL